MRLLIISSSQLLGSSQMGFNQGWGGEVSLCVCVYTQEPKRETETGPREKSQHAAARKGATAASDPMRKTDIVV